MPARKKKSQASDERSSGNASSKPFSRLYTMVVYLVGGPAGGKFEGNTIFRTIQIKGDQTLEDLHRAIFKAFNRFDEHLYEFLLNSGPEDKIATYSLPIYEVIPALEEEMAGDVRTTTIDSLNFKVDQEFGCRFDFGDNWEH